MDNSVKNTLAMVAQFAGNENPSNRRHLLKAYYAMPKQYHLMQHKPLDPYQNVLDTLYSLYIDEGFDAEDAAHRAGDEADGIFERLGDRKATSGITQKGADEWKSQSGRLTTNTSHSTAAFHEKGISKSASNVVPIGSPPASTEECPLTQTPERSWNVPGC